MTFLPLDLVVQPFDYYEKLYSTYFVTNVLDSSFSYGRNETEIIAQQIGVDLSTISRELPRNVAKGGKTART